MAAPTWATNDVPAASDFNTWFQNINFARKTVTESVTSSTTLQVDDELIVAVAANATYVVNAFITYGGAAAADLKLLFRTPTGGSFTGLGNILISAATSQSDGQNLPYGGNASEVWGCLGSGSQVGVVTGVLVTAGTAGNFQVEWAQNASSATPTQIFGNSFIDLRRVA